MIDLQSKVNELKQEVFRVACKNGQGHIASSLSCLEILVTLFYSIMTENDEFVLSKAHGGYGYYAILADKGFIPKDVWEDFKLPGCIERLPEYGIQAGCGSLGHGLPIAVGMAYAKKLQGHTGRVYCLVGDGECQEGTTWEAVQFAVKHYLNVCIIIDHNGLQAMDTTKIIMNTRIKEQFEGFGVPVVSHYSYDLETKLYLNNTCDFPIAVIEDTIKGMDIPCMSNVAKFHFRQPGCMNGIP